MPLLISVAISSVFIPKRARRNSFASNPMLVLAGFPGMLRSAGATFGLQSHFTTRCKLNKRMHLGTVTTRDTQVCFCHVVVLLKSAVIETKYSVADFCSASSLNWDGRSLPPIMSSTDKLASAGVEMVCARGFVTVNPTRGAERTRMDICPAVVHALVLPGLQIIKIPPVPSDYKSLSSHVFVFTLCHD